MNKVVVTNCMCGIAHMQVCAEKSATDEEILSVCNSENPSGTSHGWSTVIREEGADEFWGGKRLCPVQCADDPERLHFMVAC